MQCRVQGYRVYGKRLRQAAGRQQLHAGDYRSALLTYVLPQQRKGPSEGQETYYEEI